MKPHRMLPVPTVIGLKERLEQIDRDFWGPVARDLADEALLDALRRLGFGEAVAVYDKIRARREDIVANL